MIEMFQRIVPDSRTTRGSAWRAEAVIDGQSHSARSRNGAPLELARQLVAAGLSDQPVRVVTDGLRGFASYRSLHAMASRTIRESATAPVHSVRWAEFRNTFAETEGGSGPDDAQYPQIQDSGERVALASILVEA